MGRDGNAHDLGAVGAKDIEAPLILHDVQAHRDRLAREFLSTLHDLREPWAAFQTWAAERDLSEIEARAVKVQALRLRVFTAAERYRPRGRR